MARVSLKRLLHLFLPFFWLEDKSGTLWSIDTKAKVSDEEYRRGKEIYDNILSGIEVSESENGLWRTTWARANLLQARPL